MNKMNPQAVEALQTGIDYSVKEMEKQLSEGHKQKIRGQQGDFLAKGHYKAAANMNATTEQLLKLRDGKLPGKLTTSTQQILGIMREYCADQMNKQKLRTSLFEGWDTARGMVIIQQMTELNRNAFITLDTASIVED